MTDYLVKRFVRDYDQVQDPEVRERYGLLSGIVGILLNLLLSVGKFFAGLVTGSISLRRTPSTTCRTPAPRW